MRWNKCVTPLAENAIATSLEDFNLVVETFHEATIFSVNKKVSDLFPPVTKQTDEVLETKQSTFFHLRYPMQKFRFGLLLG